MGRYKYRPFQWATLELRVPNIVEEDFVEANTVLRRTTSGFTIILNAFDFVKVEAVGLKGRSSSSSSSVL